METLSSFAFGEVYTGINLKFRHTLTYLDLLVPKDEEDDPYAAYGGVYQYLANFSSLNKLYS
jgi:hypothetical protein